MLILIVIFLIAVKSECIDSDGNTICKTIYPKDYTYRNTDNRKVMTVRNQEQVNEVAYQGKNYFVHDGNIPPTDVFKLHSRIGSKKTIYIDFDGGVVNNSAWNSATYPSILYYPYSVDSDYNTFTVTELKNMIEIWKIVAEDYILFDVDVTTEYPGIDRLNRTDINDFTYGMYVAVDGGNTSITCYGCAGTGGGGIAFMNSFGVYRSQPVFAYVRSTNMWAVISHEVGHTLGLTHKGTTTPFSEYYYGNSGTSIVNTSWAPIMGLPHPLYSFKTWSKGQYPYASNTVDEIAVIGDKLKFIPDDYYSTAFESAYSQGLVVGSKFYLTVNATIGNSTDTDLIPVWVSSGSVKTNITVSTFPSSNLDVKITVMTSTYSVLGTADAVGLGTEKISIASTSVSRYLYILIDGVGKGTTSAGYSDYGSCGAYKLYVEGVKSTVNRPILPTAPPPPPPPPSYNFTGFLLPLLNPPDLNNLTVSTPQTVSFGIGQRDDNCIKSGYPQLCLTSCYSPGLMQECVTTTGNLLYNNGNYDYVWSGTPGRGCYVLWFGFADETYYGVYFRMVV